MRTRGFCLGALSFSATALVGSSALGQAPRVDFEAPFGCPDAHAFEDELSRRLVLVPNAQAALGAVRVRVEATSLGFRGQVEFRSPGTAGANRELEGERCDELVRALALVTAVVLNPEGEQKSSDAVEPSPQAPAAVVEPPAKIRPPKQRERSTPQPVSEESPAPPEPFVPRWAAGARVGAGLDTGALPSSVLAPRLALFVERLQKRWLTLSLGVSAALPSSESVVVSGVEATIRFGAVRLEACGGALPLRRIELGACGLFEVGRLAGVSSVSPQSDGASTWIAPGLSGRLRARLVGPLWLQGSVGALWPLIRPGFFVDDERSGGQLELHRAKNSGLSAEVGALVRLP